ncbi:MAG: DUF2851 family protein [Bacteroidia bacterium]
MQNPSYPEVFLHFVWRTLNFDFQHLQTVDKQEIVIQKVGNWNRNQGPDFLQAVISLDNLRWAGHVEIHLETEDWYKHQHEHDEKYNGVILHVVGKSSGKPVIRKDGTHIPEVEIGTRILPNVLQKYAQLQRETDKIPCEGSLHTVQAIHIQSTIVSMALERMAEKAGKMQERLQNTIQDWEQVLWECLMYGLGSVNNGHRFEEMAKIAKIALLKKLSPFQIEAILFGISGVLQKAQDDYSLSLQQEWQFLQAKYQLLQLEHDGFSYLRMRPATFPDLRIAQVAHLIHCFPKLISLVETTQLQDFIKTEIYAQNEYWETHYRLGQTTTGKKSRKSLGASQKEILLINTLVPFAYLYKNAHGDESAENVFEETLSLLPAENNHHIRAFTDLGITPKNSLESQGLLHLKRNFCDEKRCLHCGIGYQILKG